MTWVVVLLFTADVIGFDGEKNVSSSGLGIVAVRFLDLVLFINVKGFE